jgi:hypothetical protein
MELYTRDGDHVQHCMTFPKYKKTKRKRAHEIVYLYSRISLGKCVLQSQGLILQNNKCLSLQTSREYLIL